MGGRWPEIHLALGDAYSLRLGDSRWRFLSPFLFPRSIEAWLIQPDPASKATVTETLRDPGGISLGGELFLSPQAIIS
jgi:hypothetical protein